MNLDDTDFDWIGEVIDLVVRAQGQPWRVAFDAMDAMPVGRRELSAVRVALARLTGGRGKLAKIARRVRTVLLGVPVLDAVARETRMVAASGELGVDPAELETLMFADLRGERLIALPEGRPSEPEVAAFANIALLQRALRRAHSVKIWSWNDDGTLLRAAMSRGLLVTASVEGDATVIDIVGPLGLFQRTAVYGTTLAQLVPLLSSSAEFVVEVESRDVSTVIRSPVLLPVAPVDHRAMYRPLKLARLLERLDPELRVIIAPTPLRSERAIVCPDLSIWCRDEHCYLELVGFWTADHLERKLATYAAAGVTRVLLCVDSERGCSEEPFELAMQPQGHVIQYAKTVDASAIYKAIAAS